jgi:hypothetical protein
MESKANSLKKILKYIQASLPFVISSVLLLSAFMPNISMANGLVICGGDQSEYNAAVQVNNSGGSTSSLSTFNSSSCQVWQLVPEITHIINWMISAVGLYFVFRLVVVGFSMVVYSGNAAKIKELKGDLASAFIGFIIVMLGFIVVNTVYSILQIQINGASGFQFNPFSS